MRALVRCLLAALALAACAERATAAPALQIETTISLGEVKGRIDHLSFDASRGRLFVAERGNDSVAVIDVAAQLVLSRLSVPAPQGIAWAREQDALFVSSGTDGSVSRFSGAELRRAWRVLVGSDADNLRVDPTGARILVGFGGGGLALLDAGTGAMLRNIVLPVHPESFERDAAAPRVFVNLADAGEVAVADLETGRLVSRWKLSVRANYPMALDAAAGRLWIVSREPPALLELDARSGSLLGRARTCGDADDVFLDAKRSRLYVICGEGVIDVFEPRAGDVALLGRVPSAQGARTALFLPELDRLMVAVRTSNLAPAAIWSYRPAP